MISFSLSLTPVFDPTNVIKLSRLLLLLLGLYQIVYSIFHNVEIEFPKHYLNVFCIAHITGLSALFGFDRMSRGYGAFEEWAGDRINTRIPTKV